VYSSTQLGVKPTMYALSTLMFVTILLLLVLVNRRTKLENL
jgi:spermidine/putrescine transport system permease protein